MVGKHYSGKLGCRYTKETTPLTEASIKAMLTIKDMIHTITADNGKEFSFHEKIAEKLNVFIYFAKLYNS